MEEKKLKAMTVATSRVEGSFSTGAASDFSEGVVELGLDCIAPCLTAIALFEKGVDQEMGVGWREEVLTLEGRGRGGQSVVELCINEEWMEGTKGEALPAMVCRRDAVVDEKGAAVSKVALP